MILRIIYGLLLLLYSCRESTVLPPDLNDTLILDQKPPNIKWISPRFDDFVSEVVTVTCQIEDSSSIDSVEFWIDSTKINLVEVSVMDSIYTFNWPISNYNNGDKLLLFVKAYDIEGNDTMSNIIRVIKDDNYAYPEPVFIYPLDSLLIDSVLSGYSIKWWYSGDQYFKHYILQKSLDPLISDPENVLVIEEKSQTTYNDYDIANDVTMYYRIVIEDIFGKQTVGNVVSTSMVPMPLQWEITSVEYTENSLSVSWKNPEFSNYFSHQLIYSDKRNGDYMILEEYFDSLQSKYSSQFSPLSENWFTILTQDSIGQKSISKPFIHPPPQAPVIDSVSYKNNSFRIQWIIEPEIDFNSYKILSSDDGNAFNLSEIYQITNQSEDSLNYGVIESQYYLFQIITKDVWGLESRGPIITTSSFSKFEVKEANGFELKSIISNEDGQYIAVGESKSSEGIILAINELGEIEFYKNFGETNSVLNSIIYVPPSKGYFSTGSVIVNQYKNLLIKKIGKDGSNVWTKDYGLDLSDAGNALVSLSDGNLGITGYSHLSAINQNILVIKINAIDGSEIWSKSFGGNGSDIGHDILSSEDGGMYILSETYSQGDDDGDIWIIELDVDGNLINTFLINIPGKQIGYSFQKSINGGFIITGETSGSMGVTDAVMLEVSETGEILWYFQYGGINPDYGYSVVYSDNGWVMSGKTYSYNENGGEDAWLVKVNNTGDLEWIKIYGGPNDDYAKDVTIALDGGLIMCGSYDQGSQNDGWIIKTDSRGNYKEILPFP